MNPKGNLFFSIGALVCTLAVAACAAPAKPPRLAAADPQTRRTLKAGEIVGGEGRDGAYNWLGIPYAEPPVGDLRWREPQPAKPWPGVFEALKFGPACPQFTSQFGGVRGPKGRIAGDENCLTLNVVSPKIAAPAVPRGDARLPVMVWIHGGANAVGTARQYDGGLLAATQNVIVVTVQYRLGPLGWFRHAALRAFAKNDAERSGNFATLDLILALRWVRDNIDAFGGNPDNVTIFGESAGGRNVYSLLISPPAKGLFQRAIAESGGVYSSTPAEAENLQDAPDPGSVKSSGEIALALVAQEYHLSREAAKAKLAAMPASELNAFLRSRTAAQILLTIPPRRVALYPQLFDDGAVIAAGGWKNLTRDGAWNRVPFLAGTTRDEARLFLFTDPRFVKWRAGFVPQFADEDLFLRVTRYVSRLARVAGADLPAAAMQAQEPDVYVYRFDWDNEPVVSGADLSKMIGAAHGMEVPFVFGHFTLGGSFARFVFTERTRRSREALSQAMQAYWAEFARTGRPGSGQFGALPAWDSFGASRRMMVLNGPDAGWLHMEPNRDTEAGILAELFADPHLTPAQRCELLLTRVYLGWNFSQVDYEARPECKAFPFRIRADL